MTIGLMSQVTIALITGVWLAGQIFLPVVYSVAGLVIAGFLCLFLRRRKPHLALALFLFAWMLAGMVRWSAYDLRPTNDIANYIDKGRVLVEGKIDSVPTVIEESANRKYVRYVLKAEHITIADNNQSTYTSGGVILNVEEESSQEILHFGSEVKVNGILKGFSNFKNPGQIDWGESLRRQGITARMNANVDDIELESDGQINAWKVVVATWRDKVLARMKNLMPESDAAILNGMVFGGYGGIDRQVQKDFSATGIVHVLSVSGLHIALVGGAVLWLGRRLKIRYGTNVTLAVIAVLIYGTISGWTPVVVRAVIMGSLTLMGAAFGRERTAANILMVTVSAMIFWLPGILYDISFQLSVSATAGLIAFYSRTVKALGWLPNWLSAPIAVTIAAQLGSLPFLAWYFNTVSVVSVFANILVLPAIDIAVVFALIAVILPTWPVSVGNFLLIASSLLVGWVTNIAALLASLPEATAYIPTMNIACSLAYYSVLAWLYGYILKRPIFTPIRRMAVVTILVVTLVAGSWLYDNLFMRPVEVHFIDVGQGDATLIITPHRHAVLIDTGGVSRSGFDIGERVVVPYLQHYGICDLDMLVLTHTHDDHAGGAAAVDSMINIGRFLVPQGVYNPRLQAVLTKAGMDRVVSTMDGQQITIDGVRFCINMTNQINTDNQTKENGRSAVVKVDYGNCRFIITGDLENSGEHELVMAGKIEPVDVLKVGHHGSATSSSEEFIDRLSPKYAVISVGYGNRYGHPAATVINRLETDNAQVFRTDVDGAIVFTTDGNTLKVKKFIQ